MSNTINKSTVLNPKPIHEVPAMPLPSSELLHYGGSSAAIILAIAILLRAVGDMIKVLVPVMLQSRNQLREPSNPCTSESSDSHDA